MAGDTINNISATLPEGGITNLSISNTAGIARSKMAQETTQIFPVDLTTAKVWNGVGSSLPSSAAADDLALITGTWGTDAPTIQAGDIGGASSTRYALFQTSVPQNYYDNGAFVIRVRGGMLTTVADTSCTVDLEVYVPDLDGGVGSDICQTAAATINSLTFANVDFTLDSTAIDPGDPLLVRLAITYVDAGDAGPMTPEVSHIERRITTQG